MADDYENHKRQARSLETQLYNKLASFSKLALLALPSGADEIQLAKFNTDMATASALEAEVQSLLDKVHKQCNHCFLKFAGPFTTLSVFLPAQ